MKLTTIVENIDATLFKLSLNPRASYSIDTGQGKETVTMMNVQGLKNLSDSLVSTIDEMQRELDGGDGITYIRPGY